LLSRKQLIEITHDKRELMDASATNYRNEDIHFKKICIRTFIMRRIPSD
jgi:hypothetical protein